MFGQRLHIFSHSYFVGLAVLLFFGESILAQISPGDLHRSHASLEGVENCGKCHSPQGDQLPEKCLACHSPIADQRRAGTGLHARAEYAECNLCHVEHHGRDFDLIYFKGGMDSFNHTLTGYPLTGKHATLQCRECHRPDRLRDTGALKAANVAPDRTFLGLSRACTTCHTDQHRGQLGADCASCHTDSGWRPASGFNHSLSAFPLAGRHTAVACEKCHQLLGDQARPESHCRQYKPVAHALCSDCHRDPHQGRLAGSCSGCHTVDGWNIVNTSGFNHNRTRFPLEGRHVSVACTKCHGDRSTSAPLQFAACRDCHRDYHVGAFSRRESKGACEECHTVQSFRPSTFRLEQHATTDYPLKGAHLAIPCDQCHLRTSSAKNVAYTFLYESTACTVCHADPHQGSTAKFAVAEGCATCHTEDSWRDISFDHSTTTYPLDGRHSKVACIRCHKNTDIADRAPLRFAPVEKSCAACHQDFHRGQFTDAAGTTDCTRCHATAEWRPARFDHNRDTQFPLEGAHARVACVKCHPAVADERGQYVRYRPLERQCRFCHVQPPVGQETGS